MARMSGWRGKKIGRKDDRQYTRLMPFRAIQSCLQCCSATTHCHIWALSLHSFGMSGCGNAAFMFVYSNTSFHAVQRGRGRNWISDLCWARIKRYPSPQIILWLMEGPFFLPYLYNYTDIINSTPHFYPLPGATYLQNSVDCIQVLPIIGYTWMVQSWHVTAPDWEVVLIGGDGSFHCIQNIVSTRWASWCRVSGAAAHCGQLMLHNDDWVCLVHRFVSTGWKWDLEDACLVQRIN